MTITVSTLSLHLHGEKSLLSSIGPFQTKSKSRVSKSVDALNSQSSIDLLNFQKEQNDLYEVKDGSSFGFAIRYGRAETGTTRARSGPLPINQPAYPT